MNWILWRQAYKIFVLGAAALLFAVAAWGQGSTGTITGTVTDPSGGVVAGATVTATNTGTGTEKKTVTDNSGSYSFVDLPPGMYTITSEAVGFRKTTLSAQRLIVASNLRLDVALEVGAVTESVTVDAASPQVNAEDAQLGRSITDIPSLPLLSTNGGRNALSLVGIQPGVTTNGGAQSPGAAVGPFEVNGQRSQANNFVLDGASLVSQGGRDRSGLVSHRFHAGAIACYGYLAGITPAIHASRPDLNECLKQASRGSGGARARTRAVL